MPLNIDSYSEKFSKLELLAKQVVEGFITGLHKSPFHGFSVEFAEHKIYNVGDSIKRIDWKLFGKTDKLFTKRYEEETNLRCQIVIDASSSMYFPEFDYNKLIPTPPSTSSGQVPSKEGISKIYFSVMSAAIIMQMLKRQRDAVGLSVFNSAIVEHTDAKSSIAHHKRLLALLEDLLVESKLATTSTSETLHQIAEAIHKRSLVILFSDLFDENIDATFDAIQHLKHNKHEVIIFRIVSNKEELDFEFENRPYLFIDKETGEELKLHPNQLKESFVKTSLEFQKKMKEKALQHKVDYVEVDINDGFEKVLIEFLLKRNKLH